MTKTQKITLSASRDIPFNKLTLSQANVRHVKSGVSIEELAEDIARRTLLASARRMSGTALTDIGRHTGRRTEAKPACSRFRRAGAASGRWNCS